ncbi:reverse transcriptase [Cucumis melo var. makuwa]|uniref:Reverse transcriptase n=1 Tax=Cucumis melo var. makuwa TaxID=1194695 RepID=A0A5D3E0F5_CUCMM|nr:reverse transcriptase [Cucumis melo var. makuwa]TYK29198.1 reverse transcriptase [Cucumis melo var. makuwa]
MPSRILHLQTPLDCLKESYPSTYLISESIPFINAIINVFIHHLGNTSSPWMLLSKRTDPTFPLAIFKGRVSFPRKHITEGISERKFAPISQPPTPVQDFEPHRDGMESPTESCTNDKMSENDRSNVVVLENVKEKNSNDETEIPDLVLNIPFVTMFPTKISLHSSQRLQQALTLPYRKVSTLLYCVLNGRMLSWKRCLIGHSHCFEKRALEKNKTWEICALLKGHKIVGCKWVFSLKYKADGTLDRHKFRVLLSVAVNKDWTLYQPDAKNAFLNEDLMEEVFGCRPVDTPMEFNRKLGNDDQVPVDKEQYQLLLGKLVYLSHTHPDISFAMSVVSQFIQAPYEEHTEVINRILRY